MGINSSCLPSLSIHSSYCLLQDNFEALKGHMESLTQAFQQGPEAIIAHDHHYQEIYQRVIEASHLLQEIKDGDLTKLLESCETSVDLEKC